MSKLAGLGAVADLEAALNLHAKTGAWLSDPSEAASAREIARRPGRSDASEQWTAAKVAFVKAAERVTAGRNERTKPPPRPGRG